MTLILKLFQRRIYKYGYKWGYPEVYNLPIKAKKAWYDFYIKARITKDIANIENLQVDTLSHLSKLLKAMAGQSKFFG